jgi:hypothetical protein
MTMNPNQFARTSISRATNTARHSGNPSRQHPATRELLNDPDWNGKPGQAERRLEGQNFGLPVERERRQSKSVEPSARNEVMGARYETEPSRQRQEGDPTPHGVGAYAHPMWLGSLMIEGAPRALPVTQQIEHGPVQSRSAEFDQAVLDAADLGRVHRALGFRDRRFYGRRYRPTDNEDELNGRQPPYDTQGWQRDVNTMDRLTNF